MAEASKCLVCIQAVGAPVVLTCAFKAPAGWYFSWDSKSGCVDNAFIIGGIFAIHSFCQLSATACHYPRCETRLTVEESENEVATATCCRCQCFPHVVVDCSSLWFSFDSYTHSLVVHDPVTRNVSCIIFAFLCGSLVTRFSVLSTPNCDRAPLLSLPTEDHTHLFSQQILSQ